MTTPLYTYPENRKFNDVLISEIEPDGKISISLEAMGIYPDEKGKIDFNWLVWLPTVNGTRIRMRVSRKPFAPKKESEHDPFDALDEVLESLTIVERKVIHMRIFEGKTYPRIAEELGYTRRQRCKVREIYLLALRKLRHHSRLARIEHLRPYSREILTRILVRQP